MLERDDITGAGHFENQGSAASGMRCFLGAEALSGVLLEPGYVPHLQLDMSDERVEQVLDEVTEIVVKQLEAKLAEAMSPGGLDIVMDELARLTTWTRSELHLPVRRAAEQLGLRVSLIHSQLLD